MSVVLVGSLSGALSSIKNAYDESTDAAKTVEASGKTVDQSSAVREDSLDLQNQVQPANTRDLEKLNQQLNTKPDLSPTAKQVSLTLALILNPRPSLNP